MVTTAFLWHCVAVLALLIIHVPASWQQVVSVVQLPSTASGVKIPAYSHGFALEMSQWTKIFGYSVGQQSYELLQLLQNIKDRRGAMMIRLGGNSQDTASADEDIGQPVLNTGTKTSRKNDGASTPIIKVSSRLFDVMNDLSDRVGVQWMFGLNFGNMESAQTLGKLAIDRLGKHLYAIQIGNEPDLYAKHGLRPENWDVKSYTTEWIDWATKLSEHFQRNDTIFTGGVVCCNWQLQDLLDAGYLDKSSALINSITVQRYSSNACFGVAKGQISDYLSHQWITGIPRKDYASAAVTVTSRGKQLIMGETNTAACGGIKGISDTFVSALWWVDWQLFLYSLGFSSVELQVGGQNTFYNPMSLVGGVWVANPIYYGSLVTAEALGPGDSGPQVVHIDMPTDSDAAYAIFHHGTLKHVVLINLDAANDKVYTLKDGWGKGVAKLQVKRLTAKSVLERRYIYWAGQTLKRAADGQLRGNHKIYTIECGGQNSCDVAVPKGSIALVAQHFDPINTTVVPFPSHYPHAVLPTVSYEPPAMETNTVTDQSPSLATGQAAAIIPFVFGIITAAIVLRQIPFPLNCNL